MNSTQNTGFPGDEKVDRLIEIVRELRPLLQKNAPMGEKQRSPMQEVVDALDEHNIFRMLQPTRWGGLGISPTGFARVQMEIAKGDPSISWVVQILNGQTWVATLGTDELQESMFSSDPDKQVLICGAYNPPGKAEKVDGGYIVNGAWPYCSGSRQGNWVQSGCVITDEESGKPVTAGINMAYFPIEEGTIKDTWFVTGMQGTGSDTIVAKDVFVPDERMVVTAERPFGDHYEGKKHVGAPSDYIPVVPMVRSTGLAQLVGAAEYMLELVEEDAPKKPIVTTTITKRTDSGNYMYNLGKAASEIDSAKKLMLDACRQVEELGLERKKFTTLEAGQHKGQCSQVTDLIHSAIERLMFLAGSSSFSLDKPIQRYWRDVHVGLRHVTNIPYVGYEIYSRDRLEVENISPPGAY
mgnify:CR=1 FL=1